MYKKIVVETNDGRTLIGKPYKVISSSPILFDYPPYATEQDFHELSEILRMYVLSTADIKRWHIEQESEESMGYERKD